MMPRAFRGIAITEMAERTATNRVIVGTGPKLTLSMLYPFRDNSASILGPLMRCGPRNTQCSDRLARITDSSAQA